jgi:POT family proton-dependent oligopeptide transporter
MAIRPDPQPSLDAARADKSFFGHPRGLATLFFTEMWERFSYYGMRALLILFMTASAARGGLGFSYAKAGAIYGLYTGMVYLLSLPGGWVADRITGQRRAVLYGGILITCGQFCLVTPSIMTFYVGLVLLVMGTGLLKPNVSTIVGQIYAPGDRRRDSGFSIFYMGINLGALISPFVCGYVGEKIGWHLGFGLAGVGMIAGLIQYTLGGRHLGAAGLHPATPRGSPESRRQKRQAVFAAAGGVALLAIVGALAASGVVEFTAQLISNALGVVLILLTVVIFSWLLLGRGWSAEERKRSAAILVLFLSSAVFWFAFEQAGSSLNLFAEGSVDRYVRGFQFPASWFQLVQPFFIITFAPVFAWMWIKLGRREPPSPAKFALGLLSVSLGFAILVPVAGGRAVSPFWLILTYFLHTLGELFLSPVGLSAMTKLAPTRLAGMTMGLWFVSTGAGNYLGGRMASLYGSMSIPALFGIDAGFALGAALVMVLLIKPTVRMMSGVK